MLKIAIAIITDQVEVITGVAGREAHGREELCNLPVKGITGNINCFITYSNSKIY